MIMLNGKNEATRKIALPYYTEVLRGFMLKHAIYEIERCTRFSYVFGWYTIYSLYIAM